MLLIYTVRSRKSLGSDRVKKTSTEKTSIVTETVWIIFLQNVITNKSVCKILREKTTS